MTMVVFPKIESYLLQLTELFVSAYCHAVATYLAWSQPLAPDLVNRCLIADWECSTCILGRWEILLWW
jgi:hypothetical protein